MTQSAKTPITRTTAHPTPTGRSSIAGLMDERAAMKVDDVAEAFHMSKAQLADTAGLARAVFQKASLRPSPCQTHAKGRAIR